MNTAVAPQRWEGQIADGKFRLLQWLGGTGQSTVFRTEIPGHGRKAAIKLVPADALSTEQISRWQTAAGLSHPNLLHIFATGNCRINTTPLIYLVTELADEDLSEVLPQRALSVREVEQMLSPLLEVIGYVHQKGLVHGRIRPTNIMAVGDQLKLSSDPLRAPDAQVVKRDGFDVYDAPEIAIGAATPAADVWSIGATLVAALTQQPPAWDRKTLADPPVPESIPEPYRLIVGQCLRRNPAERCSLRQIQERLRVAHQPVPAQPSPPPLAPKRSRVTVWAPIVVLVLVAMFFGVKWIARNAGQQGATGSAEPTSTSATPSSSSSSGTDANPASSGATPQGAVVEKIMPDVSRSARMTIHGKIRVRVHVEVNPAGGVEQASLLTPGPSQYFATKALQASAKWKFKPAEARSQWVIQYLFGRNGTEASQQQLHP
jgi:TonB family protein